VHVLGADDDSRAVARAAEADALGIAGGDGSLAPVADAAIERGLPFVCIPLGTHNHFARDAGIDRNDPIGALDAFSAQRDRHVDVGRANGRLFLNNVSLGIYAELVRGRESHRRRGAALARLRALWLTLREQRPEPFFVDGREVDARVVLAANNAYLLDLFDIGERKRLDDGVLHLYLAAGLLPRTWEERSGARFVVEQRGGLAAAVDGEPARFESPLEVGSEPRALRILLP
jgi:diacylglycerol kinase family enzyme